MKPLRLEIQGINSYEKKQIVDFEKLISRGIFGIFGKTGSGKSTILDAITLALYGNIARGTKGFINSNVNDAMVLFRFEIGNGNTRDTYEIIRKFKKVINEDKISAKSGSIKLLKINSINGDNITEVLADKVKEVDAKIYDILGLTEADFLKSVVLPQGKFSEFLLLNGRAKRDMLERIFGLEEYGTNLSIKLASKKKKVENNIEVLKGKLGEFSEITEENIEENSKLVKVLEKEVRKMEKELEVELKLLNEYLEINKLNIDREKFIKELSILNSKENLVLESKLKIENSKKVDDIVNEIRRKDNLQADLNTVIKNGVDLKEELKKSKENLENIGKSFEKLSKNRDRIPEIKTINIIIKDLFEKEEEFLKLKAESGVLSEKNLSISNNITGIENTILKINAEFEHYEKLISENKKKERENLYSAEYRENVEKAVELTGKVNQIKLNKSELMVKRDNLLSELENIEKNRNSGEEKLKSIIESILEKENSFRDLKNFQMVNEIRGEILSHKDEECTCPVCGNKILNFDFDNSVETSDLSKKLSKYNEELEKFTDNRELIKSDLIKLDTLISEKNNSKIEIEEKILKFDESLFELEIELSTYFEKYGVEDFISEKNKIINSEKLLANVRAENIKIEENLQKIKNAKNQNEKNLNADLLELDLTKNRLIENENKIQRIVNSINENLKNLDFNNFINTFEYEKKIKNIEFFNDLMEDTVLEDISILKDIYIIANEFCKDIDFKFSNIRHEFEKAELEFKGVNEKYLEKQGEYKTLKSTLDKQIEFTDNLIADRGFSGEDEVKSIKLSDEKRLSLEKFIENYNSSVTSLKANIVLIEEKLNGRILYESMLSNQEDKYSNLKKKFEDTKRELIETNLKLSNMLRDIEKIKKFTDNLNLENKNLDVVNQLEKVLKGKKFVEFLSKIYLKNIVYDASNRLDSITNGRYSLEIDSEYSFVVSDNINGGIRRSIETLSGGEIFLTSLALALSLSTQIQLKGSAPLEFFFLDEGFGTLDRELLEVVMESLEKLHSKNLSVGVISHVEELKNRIPTKLVVEMDREKLTSVVNIEYS